jgi:hypothetical protein
LTERDRRTLRRTTSKHHTITAAQVTAELNIHLEDPFPQKLSDVTGLQLQTLLITECNVQMRK